MSTYICNDGSGESEIEAEDPQSAAQEYVDGGDYSPEEQTIWVNVTVTDDDGDVTHVKITIDPDEPECADDDGHKWASPIRLVGGIRENPGVHGHGGGVMIHEVCAHCGCHRHRNTWAQDPDDGTQGLDSVRYEEADDETLTWVLARRTDEIKAALEAAGLEPDNLSDDMIIAVPDQPGTEESEGYLTAIRAALPSGIDAGWTGDSDTNGDGDGETTSDLQFSIAK